MAFIVYEAWNDSLKERVVGATPLSIEALLAYHRDHAPREIAHWDFSVHRIRYVEVDGAIAEVYTRVFLESYAVSAAKPGWTTIVA